MHLILFDCDGTLADSFGLISETMRRTFRLSGFEPPVETAIHAVIGLSLGEAIQRLRPSVDPADLPAMVEDYRTSFRSIREDQAFRETLFSGIPELLSRLHGEPSIRIGMVTGKTRRGVDAVIATHRLDGVFSAIRTADDCPSKPHPAMVLECCAETGIPPERTIVIGDAIFDMAMARNAGAAGLGVAWGAGSGPDLIEAGAAAIAADVAELGGLIDRWIAAGANAEPEQTSAVLS